MNQGQPMTPARPAVSKWLWVVLVIVILIGGGFFAWYYLAGPGKTVATTTTTTPTTTPTTASTTGTTATSGTTATTGWKTYTNTTYGFSIKYPTNITPEITDSGKNIAFPTSTDKTNYDNCIAAKTSECIKTAPLVIQVNNSTDGKTETWKLSLDEIIQANVKNSSIAGQVKTTLDGQVAYEGVDTGMVNSYEILAKSGDNLLELVFGSTDGATLAAAKAKLNTTQKNLLSTFTFTK